ncbi:hypothetical protein GCM10017600_60740 [Streptosporangium carneum]|uniref:Uncharacterized protein n=1 Tax=Streptosporangium carneum TaxID=47481 RepID=A0A9W6I838_9ACTN|nr:hypothetical protein GCM10017600_60740 [Streptosporangium carneum]
MGRPPVRAVAVKGARRSGGSERRAGWRVGAVLGVRGVVHQCGWFASGSRPPCRSYAPGEGSSARRAVWRAVRRQAGRGSGAVRAWFIA